MINGEQLHALPGRKVFDAKGKVLGKVRGIFEPHDRSTTDWITVTGAGPLRRGQNMVPVIDATRDESGIKLAFNRKTIRSAPAIGDIEDLTTEELDALRSHYGVTNEDRGHGAGDRRDGGLSEAEEEAARVERRSAAVRMNRPEDTTDTEDGTPLRIQN